MSTVFWIFAGLISVVYLCCIAWAGYELHMLMGVKREKVWEFASTDRLELDQTILGFKQIIRTITWIWLGIVALLVNLDLIINHITILGE